MVEQEVIDFFNSNILSIDIWKKKYRINDETFDEWIKRISNNNKKIASLIIQKKFLFGGRTLANRGTNNGSYSNCYSIGFVGDSLEDILKVNTEIALTFKAQGGQGLSLSKIRPKGVLIGNKYEGDGIVPFMEMYNTTTNSISQCGHRKGALLMSIDAWHKEAETFINIKSDHNKINKANLSVEIDNQFMEIVKYYYTTEGEYDDEEVEVKQKYQNQTIVYTVNPVKLYKKIIEQSYYNAEPGVIFTDRFRHYNIMEHIEEYKIETCNPCGLSIS
jgi:ribonucleoside-diphosphate reductase alpha chain